MQELLLFDITCFAACPLYATMIWKHACPHSRMREMA